MAVRELLPLLALAVAFSACRAPTARASALAQWSTDFDSGADPLSGWTIGNVSGVVDEAYEVRVENGALLCRCIGQSAYQTAWRTLALPPQHEELVARLTVRLRHDSAAWAPLCWLRVDADGARLAMHDSREPAQAADTWELREIELVAPPGATQVAFGVGLLGTGAAQFDDLSLRIEDTSKRPPASREAREHLDEALDILESRSFRRDSIDWPRLRATAHRLARGARSASDARLALRYAIGLLGDGHSSLLDAPRAGDANAAQAAARPMPTGRRVGAHCAYVQLPEHRGGSGEADTRYADACVRLLTEFADARGFVVDLRENDGGSMWPMLAGLSPLLLDGAKDTLVVGAFSEPGSASTPWTIRAGAAGMAGSIACRTSFAAPSIAPQRRVAVLIGPRTASSGEATLVAFLGRPNTRTFGRPTAGLSTVNADIPLSDGALLVLTVGAYADRDGREYGARIEPQVPVAAASNGEDDATLVQALAWLEGE